MKIAIVGGAPSSWHLAPFANPEWEIWVLGNQLDRYQGKRISRIFEIHDDISEHGPEYPRWLADKGVTLVVGDKFPITGEHIEQYPENSVRELMDGKDHLTSSPSYMMGYALWKYWKCGQVLEEIGIYGCDMAVDDHEYFYQRPTMYAWIGYALGKAIKITIPDESPLFKDTYIEGQGGGKPKLSLPPFTEEQFKKKQDAHEGRVKSIKEQIQKLSIDMNAHAAASQVYDKLRQTARAVESGQRILTLKESSIVK